ncbi:MAG: ABC transporter ATP-binding protein [Spirochaetaceae bacterium]|jgi:ATP-binding cassette subfamily B protein/ATP-binding cassette subfamily C protein|nr:ABC transporter ATP-binding protein [Spirochaetaceae bacterium]
MRISSLRTIPQKLNALLTRRQKIFLLILLAMTVFLSIVETIGVSAIMPFITAASNPAQLDEGAFKAVYDFLGFTNKKTFIAAFGVAIVCFYFFRSAYNVAYTYILTKFSLGTRRNFALKLLKIYFSIPYRNFVQKNSSEIIQIVAGETSSVSQLLLNVLQIFSELFTVLMLYGFMVAVNWKMTLGLTAILVFAIYIIATVLIRKTRIQGIKTTEANMKQSRVIHEAFGNFKFIKLRGNEKDFLKRYDAHARTAAQANVISTTLGSLPRSILENIGFSLLVGVVIVIIWTMNSPQSVIPIISMYALALYRMLPAINKMLSNINNVAYYQNSLNIVYDAIRQETETEGAEILEFKKSIRIESISFKYLTGSEVLQNISFEIQKGDSVAITGESGGGKSTLVDILIGVNRPTSGALYVDGEKITSENIRSWRGKIGYIPQSIYLFDGTVAENVTFTSDYNEPRLVAVLKMANIWDFLEKKDGTRTRVGEGGIQLSGGQKQRVGIARALYTNPEVLVLDEATSALDNETEGKIMDEIYTLSQDKTLIMIAHRLTTVERCKRRVVIADGEIAG